MRKAPYFIIGMKRPCASIQQQFDDWNVSVPGCDPQRCDPTVRVLLVNEIPIGIRVSVKILC